ncbi:MAG: hypothetical protein K6G10_11925 [Butyrivibrio sp.]|nr:hypothetical protein [Butyrivibrio sp.]
MRKKLFTLLLGFCITINSFSPIYTYAEEAQTSLEEEPSAEPEEEQDPENNTEKDNEDPEEPAENPAESEEETQETEEAAEATEESEEIIEIEENSGENEKLTHAGEADILASTEITVNGEEVTDNTTVSLDDAFRIAYKLKSPIHVNYDEPDDDGANVYEGQTYTLPSVDVSVFNLSEPINVTVRLNNGTEFGTATVGTDGQVSLTVTYSQANKDLNDVVVGLDFSLNASSVGDSESYEIVFPTANGTSSVTVKIGENQPLPPTVSKIMGDLDANDDILWTIKVEEAANPVVYQNGYTLIDTFNSTQSYVEGTLEVNGVGATPELSNNDKTLTASFPGGSATTYITYKTHVDFLSSGSEQNNGAITLAVKNKATLYDADDTETPIADPAEVTDEVTSKALAQWLFKDGGSLNAQGEATWEININTNGYNFKNFVLYDVFTLDNKTSMILEEDSIVVKDGGSTLTKGDDYVISNTPGTSGKGKAYTWSLKFLGENGDYKLRGDHSYTITYTTKIEDYIEFLRSNHDVIPSNHAFLEYEYDYTGNGDYKLLLGPTLDKKGVTGKGAVVNAAIDKSFDKYDASTQEITWKVVANKTMEPITGVIVEEIMGEGQELVSISNAKLTAEGNATSTFVIGDEQKSVNTDGNTVIDFGDALDGKMAEFTVVTKLTYDQRNIWSDNKEKTYTNKVVMITDQLVIAQHPEGVTDSANCKVVSKVFDKAAGTYNYDTHEIAYRLTVNENKMDMAGGIVTDDLGNIGLSLVDGTVKIGDGNGNDVLLTTTDSENGYYTYNSGVLKIHLPRIHEKKVITFTAKVNDGDIYTSVNGGEVSVTNSAQLETGDTIAPVVVEANPTKWNNTVIKKTRSIDPVTKNISYTVTFNGNKQVLAANLIVRDTLGKTLSLDETSVKLMLGQIDPVTGVISSTGREETGYKTAVTTNEEGKTVLEVTLPQKQNNTNIYVLTYSAMPLEISSNGDYTNNIQLVGYLSDDNGSSRADVRAGDFSGGWEKDPQFLNVTVVDKDDNEIKLPGTKLAVKDSEGNSTVLTLTTGADGKKSYVGTKLKDSTTYKLSEISGPEGYEQSDEVVTFTTKPVGGKENATSLEYKLTKKSKTVKIIKTDSLGEKLAGAELTISRTLTDGTVKTTEFTSEADPYEFTASCDVRYTLHEVNTPSHAYDLADDITFYVGEDGNVRIMDENGAFADTGSNEVTMVDVNRNFHSFTVEVLNRNNVSLSGATVEAFDSEKDPTHTNPLINKTTVGSTLELSLPDGTYDIVQTTLPTGYEPYSETELTIKIDEGVFYKQTQDGNPIDFVSTEPKFEFIDTIDETQTVTVNLIERDNLGNSLKPVSLALYEKTEGGKTTNKLVEWVTDGEPKTMDVNYQSRYLLVEEKGLKGYVKAKTVEFTVDNEGDIKVKKAGASETWEDCEDNRLVVLITKKKPASKGSDKKDESGSGNTDNDKKEDSAVINLSAKANAAGTAANAAAAAGAAQGAETSAAGGATQGTKLAKTGGFVGTLPAYIIGILMVAGGVLTFKKRKEDEKQEA